MSSLKPQYIANLLIEKGTNLGLNRLDNLLISIIRATGAIKSEEEILDYVEANSGIIAQELFQKRTEHLEDGINSSFDIQGEGNDYYVRFFDNPAITLLRSVQMKSSAEFEEFCGIILAALGATPTIEGGKDDMGIDFVVHDLKINKLPGQSTIGSRISLIGQAKRYKDGNHITLNELRHFIGASVHKLDQFKKTRSKEYGVFQPTILAFWTTSDFHTHAKDYAKIMGVWYLNGIALCQLAIDLGVVTHPT